MITRQNSIILSFSNSSSKVECCKRLYSYYKLVDWMDELVKNPEKMAALGYTASITLASVYAAYRNDFGAADRTTREPEQYLEEKDPGLENSVQVWKAHEYRQELQCREELPEVEENFYDEARSAVNAND